jgi:hypothetical protein
MADRTPRLTDDTEHPSVEDIAIEFDIADVDGRSRKKYRPRP